MADYPVQTMEDRIRTAQDTSYLPKFARSGTRFGDQLYRNRMRGLQRMTGSMFRGTEGFSQHNTRPTGGMTYPPGHGQSDDTDPPAMPAGRSTGVPRNTLGPNSQKGSRMGGIPRRSDELGTGPFRAPNQQRSGYQQWKTRTGNHDGGGVVSRDRFRKGIEGVRSGRGPAVSANRKKYDAWKIEDDARRAEMVRRPVPFGRTGGRRSGGGSGIGPVIPPWPYNPPKKDPDWENDSRGTRSSTRGASGTSGGRFKKPGVGQGAPNFGTQSGSGNTDVNDILGMISGDEFNVDDFLNIIAGWG